MDKIDISTIRGKAASLITLNDGYLLYQAHAAKNINLLQDKSLNYSFVIEGEFSDVGTIKLYVGDLNTHGNCSCMEKGLCKHEVCLYFELRDRINQILDNKELRYSYETNIKVDRFINVIYNNLLNPYYENLEIYPTLVLDSEYKLFLDVIINGKKIKIKDIKKFINAILNNEEYTFNFDTIKLDVKSFSERSNKLINIIKYLDIFGNQIKLDPKLFDLIYTLYDKEIYVYNGYYSKPYEFVLDEFPIKINVYDNKLKIEDISYDLIASTNYDYVIYKEKIYVVKNHTLFIMLDYLKKNSSTIEFNKKSYNSFLVNVYPYVKDYIFGVEYCYDLSIDTYLDYENNSLKIKYQSDIDDDLLNVGKDNYLKLLNKFGFNDKNDYTLKDFDMMCEFITYHLPLLEAYGSVHISDNVSKIKSVKQGHLSFRLVRNGGVVDFIYDDSNYSADDVDKMILSYKEGKKYIELKGKTIELNYDELKDFVSILNDLDLDGVNFKNIKLYEAYYLNTKYQKYIKPSGELKTFYNDMVNYNLVDVKISDGIKNVLRDYQISGVKWLKVLSSYGFGGILADDMGLGKTLQIISLIDSVKENRPIIIVSPTSLIFNWGAEFKKFAPHIPYEIMYDRAREDVNVEDAVKNNKVLIISYEALRADISKYKDKKFHMMIIDEAQFIKNPDALKTIAVKSINADIKIALTGTPIENSLQDLWSIFDFVLPGYLGKKNHFLQEYDNYMQSSNTLYMLNKRIQPFILRRLKTDVLDLEEKIESVSYSIMSKEEKDLYHSYLMEAKENLKQDGYKMTKVLSVLTRLRELACEPRLFLDNINIKNSKMDLLMEIVEEKISDGHKILLFSQFTSIFPFIEQRLKEKGISYLTFTGQTKSLDRAMYVEKFNQDNNIKIFLISLKAGGTGLNLTSADTVIHYDPWWNNAVMNQATDRCYRIGQTRVVHEIKLVAKDTIEERILELQDRKKNLFNSVISEDEIIKKITLDDLKGLFE